MLHLLIGLTLLSLCNSLSFITVFVLKSILSDLKQICPCGETLKLCKYPVSHLTFNLQISINSWLLYYSIGYDLLLITRFNLFLLLFIPYWNWPRSGKRESLESGFSAFCQVPSFFWVLSCFLFQQHVPTSSCTFLVLALELNISPRNPVFYFFKRRMVVRSRDLSTVGIHFYWDSASPQPSL